MNESRASACGWAAALTLVPSVAFASDFTPLVHLCAFGSLVVMGALFWIASLGTRSKPQGPPPTPSEQGSAETTDRAPAAASPSPPRPSILLRSVVWGTLIALCLPIPRWPAVMVLLAEPFGRTGMWTELLGALPFLIPACSALVAARLWIQERNITR